MKIMFWFRFFILPLMLSGLTLFFILLEVRLCIQFLLNFQLAILVFILHVLGLLRLQYKASGKVLWHVIREWILTFPLKSCLWDASSELDFFRVPAGAKAARGNSSILIEPELLFCSAAGADASDQPQLSVTPVWLNRTGVGSKGSEVL